MIFETFIIANNQVLVRRVYNDIDELNDQKRNAMISAMREFTSQALHDSIRSFTISDYTIVYSGTSFVSGTTGEKIELQICSIIDKETDEELVSEIMDRLLKSFQTIFPPETFRYDGKYAKKFTKFAKRIDSEFGDLILSTEDRMSLLF